MDGARPIHDALWNYACDFDALALIRRYHVEDQSPEPGIIRNFLGTRIEPVIHPSVLEPKSGTVEGLPFPGNWHADIAEWAAALLSVERAADTYRIVEAGCGWGCWMVNMGVAARNRGLDTTLIGIEGEARHLINARRTLSLNGFEDDSITLKHGVAGPKSGHAIFPRTEQGQVGWGGEAIFDPTPEQIDAARRGTDTQVLDCVTLGELSGDKPIDLLHIDIQGAEADFVAGNIAQMDRYVRHVLIGTHSRVLEGALVAHLSAAGWRLEMERPAIMPIHGGKQYLAIDGVQFWVNRALEGRSTTEQADHGR